MNGSLEAMAAAAEAVQTGSVDVDSEVERDRRGCTGLDLAASRRAARRRVGLFLCEMFSCE